MKRNGFTLVEMMAVIVLVSVLAVIAVATYTNVNESAKNKTLESKKEEIRSSAMKWARENNITNKTIISVNALVVEGYLTADKNEMGKIGYIENPVTGDNMICNTVDIYFKENEMIADVDDSVQNCDLATQSLIDTNIDIKVIDENNVNKTGSGSIANWTNKNVLIVVSSSTYDSNAVSISFDFEGNTKTKIVSGSTPYTGSSYLNKTTAETYYNTFNIDGNLLLNSKVVVTYNLNDGTTKSRAYTIRIDKEEATASIKANNEWLTTDKPLYVLVDDGQGSGANSFFISTDENGNNIIINQNQVSYTGTPVTLDIGKYYLWTTDNAGNRSVKPKVIFEVNNIDRTVPWCEVYFDGTEGDHGWFKEDPVQPYGRNDNDHLAGLSGFNLGVNQTENSPEYSIFAEYDTTNAGPGELRNTNTVKAGEMYYCHVKTLAGNYANNSKRLYLDMDPPTISINITSPDVHTKTKDVTISLYDALSGLNATTNVRLGFSLSPTGGPTTWETVTITAPEQTNNIITKTVTVGSTLTGTWYLWIDTSSFTDYAGNYAVPTGMADGKNFVYGPYKFDNTAPQCTSNNGKTTWTDGSYLITQYCGDAAGTTDQSGCTQGSWSKFYAATVNIWSDSLVIYDNAGNYTTCPFNVYLDNDNPTCNGNNGKSNWTTGSWTGNQYCVDNYSGCQRNPFTNTWSSSTDQSSITISDNLGHTTSCPISVRLDTEPPVCTTTSTQAEGSWTNGTVTLTGTCTSDSGGSGCKSFQPTASFSDEQAQSQTPGSVGDVAGNETPCPYFTVRIDKTLPYISCSKTSGIGSTSGVNVTVVANDSLGRYQSGYKTTTPSGTTGLKGPRTYTAYDYAGNSNSCSISVTSSPCNCYYHYSAWGSWGSCNTGAPTVGSDTWQCTGCTTSNAQAGYKCRSRSKWWACDDTCYY